MMLLSSSDDHPVSIAMANKTKRRMFLLLQFNTILNAQHNTNKHTAYYLLTSYLSLSVATHYRKLQLLYSCSFFLFFFP